MSAETSFPDRRGISAKFRPAFQKDSLWKENHYRRKGQNLNGFFSAPDKPYEPLGDVTTRTEKLLEEQGIIISPEMQQSLNSRSRVVPGFLQGLPFRRPGSVVQTPNVEEEVVMEPLVTKRISEVIVPTTSVTRLRRMDKGLITQQVSESRRRLSAAKAGRWTLEPISSSPLVLHDQNQLVAGGVGPMLPLDHIAESINKKVREMRRRESDAIKIRRRSMMTPLISSISQIDLNGESEGEATAVVDDKPGEDDHSSRSASPLPPMPVAQRSSSIIFAPPLVYQDEESERKAVMKTIRTLYWLLHTITKDKTKTLEEIEHVISHSSEASILHLHQGGVQREDLKALSSKPTQAAALAKTSEGSMSAPFTGSSRKHKGRRHRPSIVHAPVTVAEETVSWDDLQYGEKKKKKPVKVRDISRSQSHRSPKSRKLFPGDNDVEEEEKPFTLDEISDNRKGFEESCAQITTNLEQSMLYKDATRQMTMQLQTKALASLPHCVYLNVAEEVKRIEERTAQEARRKYNQMNHETRIAWFAELESEMNLKYADNIPVMNLMAKLKRLTTEKLSVQVTMPRFFHVVSQIPTWDLCTPDMQSAISFVQEKVLQIPDVELKEWLQKHNLPVLPSLFKI